jgi:hypothetical protein
MSYIIYDNLDGKNIAHEILYNLHLFEMRVEHNS